MGIRSIILGAIVMAPVAALAGVQFEIAGIKITTADEGWEIFDAKGAPVLTGSGGIDGVTPGEGKLLVKRTADKGVQAMLLITGNRGRGNVTLRGSCPDNPPRPGFYEFKHGNPKGGPRTCATVAGPFEGAGTLKNFEYLAAAQADRGLPVPEEAYFFWGYAFDQNGAMFSIDGLTSVDFAGLEHVQPANAPGEGVEPAIAAWGDAFGKAIKQAHEGIFSRSTTLPPFKFSSPP